MSAKIELDVRNVHKSFGGIQALNGVSFTIRGNELVESHCSIQPPTSVSQYCK